MAVMISFVMGVVAGAAVYHYLYAEKYRSQDLACNEKDKDKELYKQLERLMAYGGREA